MQLPNNKRVTLLVRGDLASTTGALARRILLAEPCSVVTTGALLPSIVQGRPVAHTLLAAIRIEQPEAGYLQQGGRQASPYVLSG